MAVEGARQLQAGDDEGDDDELAAAQPMPEELRIAAGLGFTAPAPTAAEELAEGPAAEGELAAVGAGEAPAPAPSPASLFAGLGEGPAPAMGPEEAPEGAPAPTGFADYSDSGEAKPRMETRAFVGREEGDGAAMGTVAAW